MMSGNTLTKIALTAMAWTAAVYGQGQSTLVTDQRTGVYQILDLRLRLNRILPATTTVPEGRYLVRLRNGITPDEFPVALDDDKGAKVVQANHGRGRGKSSWLVDLKPGVHRLYVPGRTQWSTTITVIKK